MCAYIPTTFLQCIPLISSHYLIMILCNKEELFIIMSELITTCMRPIYNVIPEYMEIQVHCDLIGALAEAMQRAHARWYIYFCICYLLPE